MQTAIRRSAMTLHEWGELDDDIEGELVDGVLEEEEMPTWLHEIVATWFIVALSAWADPRGGLVAGSDLKVAVGHKRGRKPDVSVFLREMPELRDALVRAKPYLVVEVLSPRLRDQRRDRVDKVRDYAACGAGHYWIVDPQLRTVEFLRFERPRNGVKGARRMHPDVLIETAERGKVRPRGFTGLVLDLDELWEKIDSAEETPRKRRR